MKRFRSVVTSAVAVVLFSNVVLASEVKTVGVITSITKTENSATVVLKDTKIGKDVTVKVNDEMTLNKIKDGRLQSGDEVRVKYDDTNNIVQLLRKTAGC